VSEGNGELPEGWVLAQLADVTCTSNERVEPSVNDRRPYVGLEHIDGGKNRILSQGTTDDVRSTKSVFRAGDVLYGKLRPYLRKVCRPDFDGVCSTDILVFPECEALDNRFLLQFLSQQSTAEFATQNANGINLPRISAKALGEISLNLPPLVEQQRIVSKIESLQERSRRAREALAEVKPLLDQFRQSVLAAAFRGDLTADWRAKNPDVEPASELLKRIRTERRRKWEEAELAKYEAKDRQPPQGWQDMYDAMKKKAVRATIADVRADGVAIDEIPEGWELVRIGDIASLQAGYAFKSKWFTKTGVRLLRGTNIEPGSTRWTDTVHLPTDQSNGYAEYLLNEGDVVIAMDRPVISTGLKVTRISETDLPALLLQRVGRFQPEDRITPEFVYQFVQSPFFMRHIGVQATGTQLPHISANDIESAILPLPPLEEQAAMVEIISRSLEMIEEVETALANSEFALTHLDQSILAKAFRGELVPQDPNDEPASVLLERIRQQRGGAPTAGRRNRKTATEVETAHADPIRRQRLDKGQTVLNLLLLLEAWEKPVSIIPLENALGLMERPDLPKSLDRAGVLAPKAKQNTSTVIYPQMDAIYANLVGKKVIRLVGKHAYELIDHSRIAGAAASQRKAARDAISSLTELMKRQQLDDVGTRRVIASQLGQPHDFQTTGSGSR